MGRWNDRPDDSPDDWRGWKSGKYDNRYRGSRRSRTRFRHKNNNGIKITLAVVLSLAVGIGLLFFTNQIDLRLDNVEPRNDKSQKFDIIEDYDIVKNGCTMTSNGLGDTIINCSSGENYNCKSNSSIKSSIQKTGMTQDVTIRLADKICQVEYIDNTGKTITKSFTLVSQSQKDQIITQETEIDNKPAIKVPSVEIKIPEIKIPEIKIPALEPPPELTLEELRQIALDDINKYRTENGLGTISLGSAISPQRYAEELLKEGCIHHISDRGEGPMLRYKNNGDTMYLVAENIAGGLGTRWMTPKESILDGNNGMMFDDAGSNWGHRDNILNPSHRSVSIGIAYDYPRLVMVQDFEQVLPSGYQYDPSSFMTEPVDGRSCW